MPIIDTVARISRAFGLPTHKLVAEAERQLSWLERPPTRVKFVFTLALTLAPLALPRHKSGANPSDIWGLTPAWRGPSSRLSESDFLLNET